MTKALEKFVCAFRGRRDSYQVPLALAEVDGLEEFITDAYATPMVRRLTALAPAGVRAKVAFRHERGIPDDRVSCLWGTTFLEHARHRLGFPSMMTYMKLDGRFSEAAARAATRHRADLFLYSPYAWEAFTAKYPHSPRRVLFQYHPHPDLERRLLTEDGAKHPGIGESFSGMPCGPLPEALLRRERDAWQHADLIFCASRFTQRSLVEAGCDEARCRIVPYGIDVPTSAEGHPPDDAFHAMFVGSGGQRKGLHHLLMAWKNARLPSSSKLTVVCRVIDRGVEALLATTPRVELRRGVVEDELRGFYARSSLFVMPSLVEGFGQVYLEALAQGCPVLGTVNTCLPDIGGEADGVFLTPAGDGDTLVAKLEQLAKSLPGNREIRPAARAAARRFPWGTFRKHLILHLRT